MKSITGIEIPQRAIEDVALTDGAALTYPRRPKEPPTTAPPTESAPSCESDPDVLLTTPKLEAARCDLFFVDYVIRVFVSSSVQRSR